MCFSYLVELSKVCSKSYIACSLYVLAMINRTKKLLKVSCMQVMDVIIVCVLVSWSWYKCISSHTLRIARIYLRWFIKSKQTDCSVEKILFIPRAHRKKKSESGPVRPWRIEKARCKPIRWKTFFSFAPPFFALPWKANFFFCFTFLQIRRHNSEFLFTLYFPYQRYKFVFPQ